MKGKVKSLNKEKGFGFIIADDGQEYFFHMSGLKNMEIEALERGRPVTFKGTEGRKGPRAEEIYA